MRHDDYKRRDDKRPDPFATIGDLFKRAISDPSAKGCVVTGLRPGETPHVSVTFDDGHTESATATDDEPKETP